MSRSGRKRLKKKKEREALEEMDKGLYEDLMARYIFRGMSQSEILRHLRREELDLDMKLENLGLNFTSLETKQEELRRMIKRHILNIDMEQEEASSSSYT